MKKVHETFLLLPLFSPPFSHRPTSGRPHEEGVFFPLWAKAYEKKIWHRKWGGKVGRLNLGMQDGKRRGEEEAEAATLASDGGAKHH